MGNHFQELYNVDLSGSVDTLKKEWEDKKTGEKKSFSLSYLHWSAAIKELRTRFPSFAWKVREFEGGRPYLMVERGAMVYVSVTIDGDERGTWLPVMNQKHEAIDVPDAFDINTAHWRCFVKACALHGLGLKLFEGDDAPADKPASKHPPMKAPGNGVAFNLAVTLLGAREFDKNWKVDGVTENGESLKLTIWKRLFTSIPATGETVLIAGKWECHEKYGDSVTVEKIAAITDGEGSAGAGQGEGETKKIADSPAARAQVLKKYKALTEQAEPLGVKFETPEQLRDRGADVDDLMEAGVKLSAAIEKAKRDATDTGSQEPPKKNARAAAGWPA